MVPSEELFSRRTNHQQRRYNVDFQMVALGCACDRGAQQSSLGTNRQQRCDSHFFVIHQEVVDNALVIVVLSEELFSGQTSPTNAAIIIFG